MSTPIMVIEERLAEVEERLRALAEHVPGVVYSYDFFPGRPRKLNYLGPGLDELVGPCNAARIEAKFEDIFDLIHPADLAQLRTTVSVASRDCRTIDAVLRIRNDSGRYIWARSVCRPLPLPGEGTRWHIVLIDVTAEKRFEHALHAVSDATAGVVGAEFFAALVRSVAAAIEVSCVYIAEHGPDGTARALAGWSGDAPMAEREFTPSRDFDAAARRGQIVFIKDGLSPDSCGPMGAVRPVASPPVSFLSFPVRSADGEVLGHFALGDVEPMRSTFRDMPIFPVITARIGAELERQRAEEQLRERVRREDLLLRELNHRVRNNLASLSTLVALTSATARDVGTFATTIDGRIHAMATIHNLLARSQWMPTPFGRLVNAVLPEAHRASFHMEGAEVDVPAHQAAPLAMVVHELFTNAVKHGSIGPGPVAVGHVHVNWIATKDESGHRLVWTWREGGGTAVAADPAAGVGTSLIEGLTRSELRGTATLRFPASGADHHFEMNLDPA